MLICFLTNSNYSFFFLYFILSFLSFLSLFFFSSLLFYFLYFQPSFQIWKYKINSNYPTTSKIKQEIQIMLQGILFSTLPPTISIYLTRDSIGYGYCNINQYSLTWFFYSFFIIWIGSDFYEWLYHYLGHSYSVMWLLHKDHHLFTNPTPFAVISDSPIDQFFRALPLLLFPLLIPIHLELIFFIFSSFFLINGLIQHSGYEIPYISGHSKFILTSYHHYLHHSKSVLYKPIYNGQLLQIWDYLSSSTYVVNEKNKCLCSECGRKNGEKTYEKWLEIEKPDYSILLKPSFWFSSNGEISKNK